MVISLFLALTFREVGRMSKVRTEPSSDTREENCRHEGKTGKLLTFMFFIFNQK